MAARKIVLTANLVRRGDRIEELEHLGPVKKVVPKSDGLVYLHLEKVKMLVTSSKLFSVYRKEKSENKKAALFVARIGHANIDSEVRYFHTSCHDKNAHGWRGIPVFIDKATSDYTVCFACKEPITKQEID